MCIVLLSPASKYLFSLRAVFLSRVVAHRIWEAVVRREMRKVLREGEEKAEEGGQC